MEEFAQQEEIDSKYVILEKIGSGGQANIFRVVKNGTNEEYAAKVFKKDSFYITNEINMLQEVKQYQCPYIINIIDSGEGRIIRKNRKTKVRKYFVLEKEPNGNILDYIYFKKGGIGELSSKIIFQKILIGIQCLHKHNIFHSDIKLDNIVLDENISPKICDFGYACFYSPESKCIGGTKIYQPPEVNDEKNFDGIKGDIFYLASVLMILTAGIPAFSKPTKSDSYFKKIYDDQYELYWNKMDSILNITLSPEFKDLFWKMASFEPKKRPTIDIILKHPWFNEINDIKKNNPKKFEELEEKIKKFFTDLVEFVKEANIEELKNEDLESQNKSYNRGISNNKDDQAFNSNAKPKLVNTPMKMKYCINIKGNFKPVNFMNRLCKMIKDEFGILKCHINTDPEILKFNITILKEIAKDDDENEIKNKDCNEEENENEEEEEENNDIKMQIKLYKDSEKYILRFKEIKGNKEDFLEKYEAISKLVLKLLK